MTSIQDDSDLLGVLRKLYTRIMTKYMNPHANAYHDGSVVAVPEIMSALSECIDKLATNPSMTVTSIAGAQGGATAAAVAGSGALDHAPLFPVPSSGMGMGELSAHFRSTHKHSAFPSDTGERLMQTTWEHIFASIRAAHQLDLKTARLHVELANNAFKEAAHYVSVPVYAHFSQDVVQALREINSHQAG